MADIERMSLERYGQTLDELERRPDAQVVSASFDLRTDGSGSLPAVRILREAVRRASPEDAPSRFTDEAVNAFTDVVEGAAASGWAGLFVAGLLEWPAHWIAPVDLPPRNQLRITTPPARFELERHRALTRATVAAVWTERSLVDWTLLRGNGEAVHDTLEGDTHHMGGSLGRTGQHDRGGSAEMPAGGHSKVRIEESAEEERESFARDVAGVLDERLADSQIILLDGRKEFRSRLLSHLSPETRERVEEMDHAHDRRPSASELGNDARMRAMTAQYDSAAAIAAEISSGAIGDRGVADLDSARDAASDGRLATLVLHEDAAGHLGKVEDARVHEAALDPHMVEGLLRSARNEAATIWFARGEEPGPKDVLGRLRW